MKYIMFERKFAGIAQKVPVIFPEYLLHSFVAEALLGQPNLNLDKVVSAGFLSSSDIDTNTHGCSETLKVRADEQDSVFIRTCDYLHGL